jgi:hypothetical protein
MSEDTLALLDDAIVAAENSPEPIAEPIARFEGEEVPDDDATGAK